LNRYKVRYLVVGAYAVAFYTEPRFTKDIDIWVDADIHNAELLYQALREFGAPLKGIDLKDFTNERMIYQIGIAPLRVDIMFGLSGLKFSQAWKNRKKAKYANIPINILGKGELIYSKRKIHRAQDILDVKKLTRKK
jgi:hypothetical protein